jgi:hypothetical protein
MLVHQSYLWLIGPNLKFMDDPKKKLHFNGFDRSCPPFAHLRGSGGALLTPVLSALPIITSKVPGAGVYIRCNHVTALHNI